MLGPQETPEKMPQAAKMTSLKINPKIRYLADLASTITGQSLTGYIEQALVASFANVSLRETPRHEPIYGSNGLPLPHDPIDQEDERVQIEVMLIANRANELWSESEFERIESLLILAPRFVPNDDKALLKYIHTRKDLQTTSGNGYKLNRAKIDSEWESIKGSVRQNFERKEVAMPEPIVEPLIEPIVEPAVDPTIELTKLRQTHSEVLTKRQRDKARIAELEASSAELTTKLSAAEKAVQDAVVGVPLRQMAEAISTVPSLFLDVFNKNFKVEAQPDGKLTVTSLDGKRLVDAKGKDVPFTREALVSYLTETEPESERTIVFKNILIVSRASGAGPSAVATRTSAPKDISNNFGLR